MVGETRVASWVSLRLMAVSHHAEHDLKHIPAGIGHDAPVSLGISLALAKGLLFSARENINVYLKICCKVLRFVFRTYVIECEWLDRVGF